LALDYIPHGAVSRGMQKIMTGRPLVSSAILKIVAKKHIILNLSSHATGILFVLVVVLLG